MKISDQIVQDYKESLEKYKALRATMSFEQAAQAYAPIFDAYVVKWGMRQWDAAGDFLVDYQHQGRQ